VSILDQYRSWQLLALHSLFKETPMRLGLGSDDLKRLFQGLTEQIFQVRFGVADPSLTDYLSELLLRFIRIDAIFKVRDLHGKRLDEVADMLLAADQREGRPQREILRHIGDFTLFWTGVYPDQLKQLRHPDRQDSLLDYQEQGKRSYFIASRLEAEVQGERSAVLRRLSDEFEICSLGLHHVRREWGKLPFAEAG